MKSKQKNKQQGKHKVAPPAKRRYTWWIIGVLIAVAITVVMLWPDSKPAKPENQAPSSPVPAAKENPDAGQNLLVGRWSRSDGGYVIDILSATTDGKLEAAYFNPNPIHVGRAEWLLQGGKIGIVVELRDVNYPGSTYTLEFLEREGRMVGTYYQALERVTYDVEFMRE